MNLKCAFQSKKHETFSDRTKIRKQALYQHFLRYFLQSYKDYRKRKISFFVIKILVGMYRLVQRFVSLFEVLSSSTFNLKALNVLFYLPRYLLKHHWSLRES